MIVVIVADDNGINGRDIVNLTWNFGVPFWS